jgi:5'-deoxynucleotidase YfbR-like HD superfamily hydrolase
MIHQSIDPDDTVTLSACVIQALIHDTPEGEIGDFVRTFKYRTKDLKKAIDSAESTIIEEFGPSLKAIYKISSLLTKKCDAKYVQSVVKAADFMSLHNFMIREMTRNNHEIVPFYDRMTDDLEAMSNSNSDVTFKTGGVDFKPSQFYNELLQNALKVKEKYHSW